MLAVMCYVAYDVDLQKVDCITFMEICVARSASAKRHNTSKDCFTLKDSAVSRPQDGSSAV